MPFRHRIFALAVLLLVGAASCGGGGSTAQSNSGIPTTRALATTREQADASVQSCLTAMEPVAEDLRTGDQTSTNNAQEICRRAIVDNDFEGQGSYLGSHYYVVGVFLDELARVVSKAQTAADGGPLPKPDAAVLAVKIADETHDIIRALDPNSFTTPLL